MNKELFTARYDPVEDKIIGATYGSKCWHHENRHRQQYKYIGNKWFDFADLMEDMGKYAITAALLIGFFIPPLFKILLNIGIVLLVPGVIFNGLMEADAELYSWRKTK